MDRRLPVATFGPNRALAWLTLVATLVAAVTAAFDRDPEGRLLAIGAVAVLGVIALNDLVLVPRLAVSTQGLQIRSATCRALLPWVEIEQIRVDARPRFGLARRALEVDAGPVLAVLSQRALGRDPRDVLALIEVYRPAEPEQGYGLDTGT